MVGVMTALDSQIQEPRSPSFLGTLQSIVVKRIVKPYNKNAGVVYEFTQDKALLHQYFRLREIMYRKMFGTEEFKGEEDFHDKVSYLLIARRGRLCLGGCRLTIREADEKWDLPMESDAFRLRDSFPELNLDRVRHAEISRFAIMEDSGGDDDIFYGLCKAMYDKVTRSNVSYMFVKSTYLMARNWRFVANSFGVKTTRIFNDLELPENPIHPDVKWYLTFSDLTSFCREESIFSAINNKKMEESILTSPVSESLN